MNIALSLAEAMEALGEGSAQKVGARWAQLLGVAEDTAEFYTALAVIYGRFIELKHQIAEAPQLRDRAKNLCLAAADGLRPFANPAYSQTYTTNQVAAQKDKIDLLHIAADALPDVLVPDLQPATLEQLCGELEALRKAAQGADIPSDVQRLIADSIAALLMAIRGYKIFGPDGAARIYGVVAAELMRNWAQTPPEAPATKSLLQRAIGVTKKIGAAVIFAGGVVHGADQLLTDGSDVVGTISTARQGDAAGPASRK